MRVVLAALALAALAVQPASADVLKVAAAKQFVDSHADNIEAMAADGTFVYAVTDTKVIKASTNDQLKSFGVDDLGTVNELGQAWNELTTVVADSRPGVNVIYITGKYKGNVQQFKGHVQLLKFDKMTMKVLSAVTMPVSDNVVYAMEQDDTYIYLGTYTFPGKVVRVRKEVDPADPMGAMQIADELDLSAGEDDVRSFEWELDANGDKKTLYANCNTEPGRIVKIDRATFTHGGVTTLPAGAGKVLAGSSTPFKEAVKGTAGAAVYVASNTVPCRVTKLVHDPQNPGQLKLDTSVTNPLTLPQGEDHASSMVQDAQYLYVGLWTSPAKVVKIRLSDFTRESALDLPHNRISAIVANLDTSHKAIKMELFAGLYTKPGEIVDLQGTSTPEDCVFGAWKAWSPCSVTCGNGYETRTREISVQPKYGGKSCAAAGSTTETKQCLLKGCPHVCHGGQIWKETGARVTEWDCGIAEHVSGNAPAATGTDAKCECPADKPYKKRLESASVKNFICVKKEQCVKYHVCPAGSTSCSWDAAHNRIIVKHGKCSGSLVHKNNHAGAEAATFCQKDHANTNLYGTHGHATASQHYQYHCHHTPGRLGGCQCNCYMPQNTLCPMPAAVLNGAWSLQMGADRDVGSEVKYSCNQHHTLSGSATRVCLSSGAWSGQTPSCVRVA